MFGSWPQLALPSEDLTEKERTPPPSPTQLDFPSYIPHHPPTPLTSASSVHLYRLLCFLRRPHEITPRYLQALNLSVTPDVSFRECLSLPATDSSQNVSKPVPPPDRLQAIQELRTSHSDAFRAVLRLPPRPGQTRVRLSHTRMFWIGLEKMSQYWDCSGDNYYDVPDPAEAHNTPRSDADIEMSDIDHQPSNSPADATPAQGKRMKHVYRGFRTSAGSFMPSYLLDDTASALVAIAVRPYNCKIQIPIVPSRLSVRNLLFPVRESFIVGRVPKDKEAARRSVLEGPIMGVCCRNETTFHDSSEHSQGRGKGEGVSGQEVNPGQVGKGEEWRQVLDLAREVGVMLLLAQERAREGKEEIKPGEGKWWTSTPRWGGGPGGSMGSDCVSDASATDEKSSTTPLGNKTTAKQTTNGNETEAGITPPGDATMSPPARPKRKANREAGARGDGGARPPQHKKGNSRSGGQTEKWKTLRPGPPVWDPKMRYMRIGAPSRTADDKGKGEGDARDEDQILLVSALNHHVALLSMRVSSRYLAWLAGGEEEERDKQQQQQQQQNRRPAEKKQQEGLHLRRTRWFDLFNEADRVEFVQGLWDVMARLMREDNSQAHS